MDLGGDDILRSEEIWTGPNNLKGLFDGHDLVLGFRLELGLVEVWG